MASQEQALMELGRRGELPPEKQRAYDELKRRGEISDGDVPQPEAAPAPGRGTMQDTLIGIGRGFTDTMSSARDLMLQGVATQTATNPMLPPQDSQRIAGEVDAARQQGVAIDKEEQRLFDQGPGTTSPIASTLGRITGNVASVPLPGAQGRAAVRVGGDAVLGGMEGALTPADSAGERLQNMGIGAVTGGAVTGGTSAIGGALRPAKSQNADEVVALGEEFNVPVFADDVIESKALREASKLSEKVPGAGTATRRGIQNEAQQRAANELTDGFERSLVDDGISLFEQAKGGLDRKLTKLRDVATKRYADVGQRLDSSGAVDIGETRQLAEQLIAKEMAKGSRANKELVGIMETFRDAPDGNFSQMIALRSDIGNEQSAFFRGKNEVLPKRGAEALQELKDTISRQMGDHARRVSPEAARRWLGANKFWADRISPYKEGALRRLVKSEDPESIMAYVMTQAGTKGGNVTRGRRIFQALDDKGRDAVRTAILRRALDAGERDGRAFSPQAFANELDRIKDVVPVFFRGESGRRVEGFKKLMEHTARSQGFATSPDTGQLLMSVFLAGAAGTEAVSSGTFFTAAGAASAASAVKALTQTTTGRNLLMAASKVSPGSDEMSRLARQIQTFVSRSAARQATRSDDETSDPPPN